MKKLAVLLVAALVLSLSFAATATWTMPTVTGEAHFAWVLSPLGTPSDASADNTGSASLDYSISVNGKTSGFAVYGNGYGLVWWKPIDLLKLTFGEASFSGLEDPIATAANGYSTPYKSVSVLGVTTEVSQDMFTAYVGATSSDASTVEVPFGLVVNPVDGVSFATLSDNALAFASNGDVEFALDLNKLASFDAAVKGVYRLADKSYQVYTTAAFGPVSEAVTVTGSPLDLSSTTSASFGPANVSVTVSPLASPISYSADVNATLGSLYADVAYASDGTLSANGSYTMGDLKVGGSAVLTGDKSADAYLTKTLDSGATLTLDAAYNAGLTLTLKADAYF
jgi:hypothetical protein